MEERADTLHRRISFYRRYLAEGVDADLARIYLRKLASAEALLLEIGQDTEKRK
jgi:hypothetical protein